MSNGILNKFNRFKFKLALINLVFSLAIIVGTLVSGLIPIVGGIVSIALSSFVLCVYTRLFMQVVDNRNEINIDDSFANVGGSTMKHFLYVFIQSIIITVIVFTVMFVGFGGLLLKISMGEVSEYEMIQMILSSFGVWILLIVGLVVVKAFLVFVDVVIFDKDFSGLSLGECFKIGVKLSKGYVLKYIVLELIHGLSMFLAVFTLGISLLFTESIYKLAFLSLYKESKEKHYGSEMLCNQSYESKSTVENLYTVPVQEYDYDININANKHNESSYITNNSSENSDIRFDDFLKKN